VRQRDPERLNWRIGGIFAIGSALFLLGSVLVLVPVLAKSLSLDSTAVNAVFFAGSIPFTTAAYLQLFQAANTTASSASRKLVGWRPADTGWLSSVLQFAGTLLFNINTFDGMLPDLDWLQQDLKIWTPDMAGSMLFLVSGCLAFAEVGHTWWSWQPGSLSWWSNFSNLLGCIAFMISAVLAFAPPVAARPDYLNVSVTFTLLGALGFLIGSLLMMREAAATTSAD